MRKIAAATAGVVLAVFLASFLLPTSQLAPSHTPLGAISPGELTAASPAMAAAPLVDAF